MRQALGGFSIDDERWMIFVSFSVLAAMIMARLDRLGKQLEAVTRSSGPIWRAPEEHDEVLREWKDNKQQAAKDVRQFWAFWGIIGADYFQLVRALSVKATGNKECFGSDGSRRAAGPTCAMRST